MGFLDRLFRNSADSASQSERPVGAECKRTVAVVGEFYRAGISQFLREIERQETPAVLIPEPTNRHDRNAIKVVLGGKHVGYLSRKHATEYYPAILLAQDHGEVLTVRAYGYTYGSGEHQGQEVVMYLPTMKALMGELQAVYATDASPA